MFLSIDGVKALCHEKDETLMDVKTFLAQQEISEDDAYFKVKKYTIQLHFWLSLAKILRKKPWTKEANQTPSP